MKVTYVLNNISGKNKALCVGDLVRYYGETKYKIRENLQKIKDSKTISAMIINSIRKNSNFAGVTIEGLLANLEASNASDIFAFKVNNQNLIQIFDAQPDMVIEVFMDELFFSTKAVMSQNMPGFRLHAIPIEHQIQKEKESWVKWFEKNLRDYQPSNKWDKKVLE